MDETSVRPPEQVMRLNRLGSFHQNRISFSRSLIRRMAREKWLVRPRGMDIDLNNVGEASYDVITPHGLFAFYAFATHLEPGERSDRAIAQRWDFTFALCEGHADDALLGDLRVNVPKQDDGRYVSRILAISRANKSGRIFDDVVDCLARGEQPDPAALTSVGYLLRTTAVFANGMFGMADFERLRHRGPFAEPFAAQMLVVYLIRMFSLDVVEHLAQCRAEGAAKLSIAARRYLGVGNATGLGMAPFVVSHPRVIGKWIMARERALSRVKAQEFVSQSDIARFDKLLSYGIAHVGEWATQDRRQTERLDTLSEELISLQGLRANGVLQLAAPARYPWKLLAAYVTAQCSVETQEFIHSILLELYPQLVDALENDLVADESSESRPGQSLWSLKGEIETRYAWALRIPFDEPGQEHYFWYKSTMKAEPRLGVRSEDEGEDKEIPLGIGREIARLHSALVALPEEELTQSVARFLLRNPQYRGAVQRVSATDGYPYAEVQENLLGSDLLPIDLLRCKLSFFGATKFDPKSDRWVRIALFQGSPLPDDIERDPSNADDWFCPVFDDERIHN